MKLYVFAQDFANDDDYIICDDVYYRIDMSRTILKMSMNTKLMIMN